MDTAIGEHLDSLGIERVLDIVDVSLERIDVPLLLDGQRALGDDGAAVVHLVCKVNGHARHLDAAVERVLNGMRAYKARQ